MEVVWPCWKEVVGEAFARTRVLSPYQVSCLEKMGECTNKKLTSIRSTKLLINDLLKLAGRLILRSLSMETKCTAAEEAQPTVESLLVCTTEDVDDLNKLAQYDDQ
ncbi:hypothetical protein MTO96_026729 [Rhipicephalus appendiculatus]